MADYDFYHKLELIKTVYLRSSYCGRTELTSISSFVNRRSPSKFFICIRSCSCSKIIFWSGQQWNHDLREQSHGLEDLTVSTIWHGHATWEEYKEARRDLLHSWQNATFNFGETRLFDDRTLQQALNDNKFLTVYLPKVSYYIVPTKKDLSFYNFLQGPISNDQYEQMHKTVLVCRSLHDPWPEFWKDKIRLNAKTLKVCLHRYL